LSGWGGGRGRGGPPPWAGGGGGGRRGWGGGWGAGFGASLGPQALPSVPPPPPNALRIAIATSDGSGLESFVTPRFARAPFITIVDVVDGKVVAVHPVKNPFEAMPHGAGVSLAQWLVSIGCRAAVGTNFGPNLSMVLQQAGIAMYTVPPGVKVIDALRMLGLVRE